MTAHVTPNFTEAESGCPPHEPAAVHAAHAEPQRDANETLVNRRKAVKGDRARVVHHALLYVGGMIVPGRELPRVGAAVLPRALRPLRAELLATRAVGVPTPPRIVFAALRLDPEILLAVALAWRLAGLKSEGALIPTRAPRGLDARDGPLGSPLERSLAGDKRPQVRRADAERESPYVYVPHEHGFSTVRVAASLVSPLGRYASFSSSGYASRERMSAPLRRRATYMCMYHQLDSC